MMQSNMQVKSSWTAANMNLESRQSSRHHQNSEAPKERVPSLKENQNLRCQGKLKVKASVVPTCSDLSHELRLEDGKILVQPKSSGNHRLQYLKGKAIKDDELVKYMSKLPGYLKRVEGGKSVQDKALNVGVLDWASLEEWKYKKKCTMASGSNNVSATSSSLPLKPSTFSSATQGGAHAHQSEQHPSIRPILNSSKKDGLSRGTEPSSQKALHFQDFETCSKSNLEGQRRIPCTNKSFDRNNVDVTPRKWRTKDCDQKLASEMGNLSTDVRNFGVALSPKEKVSSWDGEANKRVEEAQVSNKLRKALDRKTFSDIGTSYPKSRSNGVSLGSKEKTSVGNVETKKRTDKLQESNIDLGHHHLPGKLENIVLLLPKALSQNNFPKESEIAQDENFVEANQNRFLSGSFSPVKSCSAELSSDIPHSCPLPSEVESKIKSNLMADSLINSQPRELLSDASHLSQYSSASSATLSDGEDAEQNTIKHMEENADENLRLLEQEMADMAVTRSRNPSPNRRFSFSLSRMSRSFSWKESSAVPQLSSSYISVSGPVKSEEVSCLDDSSRQKTNGHNRARSSPLRRILDPLLRTRSSNRGRAAETVHPLKGNLSYLNFRPIVDSASPPNKKHEASTTGALLQLTMKNGLPLFKFAVDNNSSVLAATGKNLTSGKDDSGQNYTFYSVDEIKKKDGGWLSQGSKEKSGGFVYNVIGQMVSRSRFPNPKSQNLKNQSLDRESVLFGVELNQVDQASPKFMPYKDLAAVVVKMPIESLSHIAEQRDVGITEKGFTDFFSHGRCSYSSEEKGKSWSSTTVILPSGVHGLPNNGVPSPLIERWKSGGLCDCGGWDVGCKLRILANRSQMTSIACSNSNGLELFEEGAQQNRPIFSLVPLNKEIYSVEFNLSVSLLQAFFISVAVISGQKLYDLSEAHSLYEAEIFQEEPIMNEKGTKKSSLTNIVSGEKPAKYAPNPPHSPVGRV